ncbi:30S ribosomal protein S6 [bacterium]|nr:MAG: 30S ribosomal protein S6 [bacterium]
MAGSSGANRHRRPKEYQSVLATAYEICYILRPTLEEGDVETRVTQFAEQVTKNGGSVGNVERMGKRRLAYEMDDLREGYYVVMNFTSDAANAKELERQMKLSDDVLRSMIIRTDA